jgi:hypothetical protein
VEVTTSWQTVSIRFSDFSRPQWGDTVGLTTLAVDQLQMLHFNVSISAGSFEIFLDDVELF